MRRSSTSSLGALHPVLFFLVVYGMSLFLAIFVCRTVYYSINNDTVGESKTVAKTEINLQASAMNVAALK
jgi:hypothetical protein